MACYVNAFSEKMKLYLEELLENASCFEDKLKGYYIMIQALGASGNVGAAIEKTFYILAALGENFPSDVTNDLIYSELESTRMLLSNFSTNDVITSPRLIDTRKCWIMKFMNIVHMYLFMARPGYIPLVACRMVRLSHDFGYCSDSAFGLIGYSFALINILHDIDEGYRWGKIALSLLDCLNAKDLYPKMKFIFHAFVRVWVEPLQATSKTLLDTHGEALMVGDVEYASASAFNYCRKSFMCGVNLSVADKESTAVALKMVRSHGCFLSLFVLLTVTVLNHYSFVFKMVVTT